MRRKVRAARAAKAEAAEAARQLAADEELRRSSALPPTSPSRSGEPECPAASFTLQARWAQALNAAALSTYRKATSQHVLADFSGSSGLVS